MNKALYYINGLLLTLTIVSGVVLGNSTTSAEELSATASVIVPASCTFDAKVDTAHSAEIPAGTYKDEIGTTTFTTTCNDGEGFSIYAIGYSNSENGNTKLLATVGGALSPTNDINTGTNTSGTPSSWAMKLNNMTEGSTVSILSDTNGSFSNYHVVPSTNTKVATLNSATDMTVGAKVQATYAANIAGSQPAGTYNGKVKYIMVHPASETPLEPKPATARCISYWPNASGVADSMADDCNSGPSGSGYSNNASADLWASNFQRPGYGFAGWSTTYDYSDPNGFYGPNETITTPADMTTNGLSLYAIWVKSAGNLQGWNYCAALNIGDVTALTDTRDNNAYAVARLADGKCWMIENLRLESTNSDNSTGNLAQGYGTSTTYGNFSGLADAEYANLSDSTTANSLYYSGTQSGTASINIGTSKNPGYRMPRYNNQNTVSPVTNMISKNSNVYSLGNYYTWPAAIADTTSYTSNNTSVTNTSICPTDWHLPKGGSSANATNSDFWQLGLGIMGAAPSNNNQYTSSETNSAGKTATAAFRSYPNNFVYSGYAYSDSVGNRGSYGDYWSSTASSSYDAYYMSLNSFNVSPGTVGSFKSSGMAVRCVAAGV